MADVHAIDVLGLVADADAMAVLAALGADDVPARHTPPPDAAIGTWLHIVGLPESSPGSPRPFLDVLVAASGGLLADVQILISHSTEHGVQLFVSAGHPQLRDRLRRQLAPACELRVEDPDDGWRRWPGHGVRYRLQPEVDATRDPAAGAAGILDRLSTVEGDWAVLLRLASVHPTELLEARRMAIEIAERAGERMTSTRQDTSNRSTTIVSAAWRRVGDWTATILDQLSESGGDGAWKVQTWALSPDGWTTQEVVASLRGAPGTIGARRFVACDAPVGVRADPSPTSLLTSLEAHAFLVSPQQSLPGLLVRHAPPAARRPAPAASAVELGTYSGTEVRASIDIDDLEGHVFVTGTTGSGKTTTLHRLLSEAWNAQGIPFLVIDPVKDDYSEVAGAFEGGLRVVTGKSLSLDIMRPHGSEPAEDHVARVAQAFRGAFTMPSPTPYVVAQVFDRIVLQAGGPAGSTLFDVRDVVEPLVASLGYAPEANANIRASLLTRLELLLSPSRAHRFAWQDSKMLDELFDHPTVVTLADLVDDEERSFVVLVLALATWAHARARGPGRAVAHLLVLEEAHRVLPEVGADVDSEFGSARAASAELLTSMLAEVRSYGEQVVVVDQSPAKVSSDVIRNTNSKLVHRVVAPDDQRTMTAALGLAIGSDSLLATLARGQMIVSTRREPSPQTVAVAPTRRRAAAGAVRSIGRSSPRWPCCAGRSPDRHYRAWRASAVVEAPMALVIAGARVGTGSGDELRDEVVAQLTHEERAQSSRASCLAWVGMRRILVAERAGGTLPTARAVEDQLARLFELWSSDSPITLADARRCGVPRTGAQSRCPDCGTACAVRIPAGALLRHGHRTGPLALASNGWRSELGGVEEWARGELRHLDALLGNDGATRVIRCQIHQAVRRNRLPDEVAVQLVRRSGLGPKGGAS
jgi:DNA helicase HerA-like ATPase